MCEVCETKTVKTVSVHPFEIAGLGHAPFYFECVVDTGKTTTSCDYCSTGLRYVCWVKSHDGRQFKVGIDCIRKLDRDDNRLVTDAERALAKLQREKKDAERQQKREAALVKLEKLLQEQRDRNGGLTDQEIAKRDQDAKAESLRKEWESKNLWLLEVLDKQRGAFVESMIERLQQGPVSSLSYRCVSILRDIYCKSFGRYNSKKYNAACEQFYTLAGIDDDE